MQYDHTYPEILIVLTSQLLSLVDLWVERVFNAENGDSKSFPPRNIIAEVISFSLFCLLICFTRLSQLLWLIYVAQTILLEIYVFN